VVAGENYGQGSSREHAALAPRYLGVKAVLAKGFARIHWQNLINFGILPLQLVHSEDWEKIDQEDVLVLRDVRAALRNGNTVKVENQTKGQSYDTTQTMSKRQADIVLRGGLINAAREDHSPILS
jgi:aconitate hydratase